MVNEREHHWNTVYKEEEVTEVGWYEESPEKCLELIEKCNINLDEKILDVGVGASMLIDNLINKGYKNIIATDISKEALKKLKNRLGEGASFVDFVVDDITQPEHLNKLKDIALWHDRAVLHFLTKDSERQAYLSTLLQVVKPSGYVIIAAFSLDGAPKCSGLDVRRYDKDMIQEFLGDEFVLKEHFNYLYHTPSGNERPYVYTLFQRK
jgi:ubiquinone/menaquinone biosynthesis C-methylase UbiE|tara:strand:+ start:33 stop:659 length:627 start_codon:yes stop_codon:yes gene_type:complete